MSSAFENDLVALVADKRMEQALEGILARRHSLSMRPITFKILRHPEHDPGCLLRSAEILGIFTSRYRYALVMLDRDGCGVEHEERTNLEARIEGGLTVRGWDGRVAAVVIDPELEAWVWSESHHVQQALRWRNSKQTLKQWLMANGHLRQDESKPKRPKEAMLAALRHAGLPNSPSIFRDLARNVGFDHCVDTSFLKLRSTLSSWFPQTKPTKE